MKITHKYFQKLKKQLHVSSEFKSVGFDDCIMASILIIGNVLPMGNTRIYPGIKKWSPQAMGCEYNIDLGKDFNDVGYLVQNFVNDLDDVKLTITVNCKYVMIHNDLSRI